MFSGKEHDYPRLFWSKKKKEIDFPSSILTCRIKMIN